VPLQQQLEHPRLTRHDSFIVSIAVFVTPPYAAEIVTLVAAATHVVVRLNVADVRPRLP
jgi:hypothetical protein